MLNRFQLYRKTYYWAFRAIGTGNQLRDGSTRKGHLSFDEESVFYKQMKKGQDISQVYERDQHLGKEQESKKEKQKEQVEERIHEPIMEKEKELQMDRDRMGQDSDAQEQSMQKADVEQVKTQTAKPYRRGQELDEDRYRGGERGIQLKNEMGTQREEVLKQDEQRTERDRERLMEEQDSVRLFNKNFEAKRKSPLDVPKEYDDLRLNLGAEGYESYFQRHMSEIKKNDPTFNDPKMLLQSLDRSGYEHMSGRTFDPLVQGDPGEARDLKAEAVERIKNDSVNYKNKGEDATKPLHVELRRVGILSSNPRSSFSTFIWRKRLDEDEKLKDDLAKNPIKSRTHIGGGRNYTFEKNTEMNENPKHTTRDKLQEESHNPNFIWDRKMEMAKEEYSRPYKDEEHKKLARHYVDVAIPTNRPLEDELHEQFLNKYREKKGEDRVDKSKRLGSPLSTEEHGVIFQGRYKPKPE